MIIKTLIIFTLVFMAMINKGYALNYELYSQTVYLHKFDNPITQNKLLVSQSFNVGDVYGGAWIDHDKKTNALEGYTDAQVAPLAGFRSHVFGPDWLLSRGFLEGRFVHRTKSFPDERIKNTYELRGGLLGYGIKEYSSPAFLENYYSAFYSRLYGEKIILQGWTRQGLRFWKSLDLFNEIFFDTFDQTRDRDGTLDLRPGVRVLRNSEHGSVQLMHQVLYHFANTNYAGRNEARTTLVFGLYY